MRAIPISTTTIRQPRINNQIRSPELRVIDENGANLGVLQRERALAAAGEKGLDLIEIAPAATPPVARIASFDKYRYEKEKAERKERLAQKKKTASLKQIQISVKEGKHDLLTKVRRADGFLMEGHAVEITIRLRGREKRNKEWAREKLKEFLALIGVEHKVISEPRPGGRGIQTQIIKQ